MSENLNLKTFSEIMSSKERKEYRVVPSPLPPSSSSGSNDQPNQSDVSPCFFSAPHTVSPVPNTMTPTNNTNSPLPNTNSLNDEYSYSYQNCDPNLHTNLFLTPSISRSSSLSSIASFLPFHSLLSFNRKNNKVIGSLGSLALVFNNITGPAMLQFPFLFQHAGWLPVIIAIIFAYLTSTITSIYLINIIKNYPNNKYYIKDIQFSYLFKYYYNNNKKIFVFIEVIFLFACAMQILAGIVEVAQSLDGFLSSFVFNHYSYALEVYPKFQFIKSFNENCLEETGADYYTEFFNRRLTDTTSTSTNSFFSSILNTLAFTNQEQNTDLSNNPNNENIIINDDVLSKIYDEKNNEISSNLCVPFMGEEYNNKYMISTGYFLITLFLLPVGCFHLKETIWLQTFTFFFLFLLLFFFFKEFFNHKLNFNFPVVGKFSFYYYDYYFIFYSFHSQFTLLYNLYFL